MIDNIVDYPTMPAKGSTHGRSADQLQQLAASRTKIQKNANSTLQLDITNLENIHATCKLELEAVENRCRKLELDLQMEQEKSAALNDALQVEKKHSASLYQQLRVERRARQRGDTRKSVLERQISLLKSASMSSEAKKMKENAAKAIEALMKVEKENSTLQSELSKSLERCTKEAVKAQQKLLQAGKQIKGYQMQISQLRKHYNRAQMTRERAVERAKKETIKQSMVYHLLHKGIYTEDTRNLIRLLVKAGCSRKYVGRVIHAILKSAGISTCGSISKRTVSRVVVEGYYAAQVQLGHEMNNTNRMSKHSSNLN
jgi:hypothetical protein